MQCLSCFDLNDKRGVYFCSFISFLFFLTSSSKWSNFLSKFSFCISALVSCCWISSSLSSDTSSSDFILSRVTIRSDSVLIVWASSLFSVSMRPYKSLICRSKSSLGDRSPVLPPSVRDLGLNNEKQDVWLIKQNATQHKKNPTRHNTTRHPTRQRNTRNETTKLN